LVGAIEASEPARAAAADDGSGHDAALQTSAHEAAIRQMLARELHDRVGQTLTTMLVELENFKIGQAGRESVIRQVDVFEDSTREVLNSLRALLYELRGEVGVEDTLVMSLGSLMVRFQEKTRIVANLDVLPGWPEMLKSSAALNVYRIVEEALANVRLHSGAQAVRVVLGITSENELAVEVTDDGRGVDTDHARPLGLGMVGMRERALILGGQVRFESHEGDGTTVRATFPRIGVIAEELTA
jgi:signal transduction histidine kinase